MVRGIQMFGVGKLYKDYFNSDFKTIGKPGKWKCFNCYRENNSNICEGCKCSFVEHYRYTKDVDNLLLKFRIHKILNTENKCLLEALTDAFNLKFNEKWNWFDLLLHLDNKGIFDKITKKEAGQILRGYQIDDSVAFTAAPLLGFRITLIRNDCILSQAESEKNNMIPIFIKITSLDNDNGHYEFVC